MQPVASAKASVVIINGFVKSGYCKIEAVTASGRRFAEVPSSHIQHPSSQTRKDGLPLCLSS
jgi:hypothetical protein